MARNKAGRPTWFKFWQTYRRQLDIDLLSMEARGRIFTNAMRYFDGEELVPMNDIEAVCFNFLKVGIDDAFTGYEDRSRTNRENGSKGGRPKETEKTEWVKNNQAGEKIEDRIQNTEERSKKREERSVDKADKPPRASRFTPPAFDEVNAYCKERGNSIDAQRFIDHYEARGWMLGKNKMKDWRAAVRTWERTENDGRNKRDGNNDQEERIAGVTYL